MILFIGILAFMPYIACNDTSSIMNALSWRVKLKLWNSLDTTTNKQDLTPPPRRVGIQSLVLAQRREADIDPQSAAERSKEEKDMRLKLFRLMYEAIKDSDLKVKRAEIIRTHYNKSAICDMGYLIGDVTDKSNLITDISSTLTRFYDEWKPIEHINAYEQIANQAIEINNLIDLIRIVKKREEQEAPKEVKPK